MSRREQIRMTDDEVLAYLDEEKTLICATNGKDGFPHLMPLWYVVRDGELWAWTFTKSQKVRNLERDPRAAIQVESGTEYEELRGIMLKTEVELIREPDRVADLGVAIFSRGVGHELTTEVHAKIAGQAEKRIGLRFVERERATWDHRKLGPVPY